MSQVTEQLIMAVQERPVLWDMRSQGYKLRQSMKDIIWQDVALVVGEDVTECKRRWRNIKDHYRSTKKPKKTPSGSAASASHPPTKLQRMLEFLDPIVEAKPTITSLPSISDMSTEETIMIEYCELNPDEMTNSADPTAAPGPGSPDRPVSAGPACSADLDAVPAAAPRATPAKKPQRPSVPQEATKSSVKKRKNLDSEICEVLDSIADQENNPDKAFLVSLLPDLERLTPEARARLKLRIMALVTEAVYPDV